jgi:hypothetical protein
MDEKTRNVTTKQSREERKAETERVFTELQEKERKERLAKTLRLRSLRLMRQNGMTSRR